MVPVPCEPNDNKMRLEKCGNPERGQERYDVGACQLKSPMENNGRIWMSTEVAYGVLKFILT